MAEKLPLIVDLDGTLVRSDLLVESFFTLLGHHPVAALTALPRLLRGKAAFKSYIAERAALDLSNLPLDARVMAQIERARADGRPVHLASASHERYVRDLAGRLNVFTGVYASNASRNLSGSAKRDHLVAQFGVKKFDYVGNDRADIPVWEASGTPIMVNAPAGLARRMTKRFSNMQNLGQREGGIKPYLRALRMHQWLKNLLVFVPIIASHSFSLEAFAAGSVAFAAMSLCASSAYLLNDIFDLADDRGHPTKKNRPLATGDVKLIHAGLLVPILMLAGLALAWSNSTALLGVVAFYYVTTVSYSVFLKRLMLVDVLVLGGCYCLRIMAGGVARAIPITPWLLAFSGFLFLGLALMKRQIELTTRREAGLADSSRRGYRLSDLPMLMALSAASMFSAVLVFTLYISTPAISALYRHPVRLWLVAPLLIYWLGRLLMLANRGEVDDDPVVFTATDGISLLVLAGSLAIILSAI